jgi:glycosyltransferase involved in cell wall biosynthesis
MRVCLVGATHPCHNPRLIREADSLVSAGHDVRVIAPSFVVELRERDERLMKRRSWRLDVIDFCPGGLGGAYRAYKARGGRRLFEEMFRLTQRSTLVDRAYIPALTAMTAAACAEPADWFIAHSHRALPIAVEAARKWKSKVGFDCEDLLALNNSDAPDIVELLEKNYLPQCDYVSVPSKSIAAELTKTHRDLTPVVLYNVFPLSLVNGMSPPNSRNRSEKLRLYWFSQTIGPGRGVEDALKAARLLGDKVEVHLQGNWAQGYETTVRQLARELRVSLHVHTVVDHDLFVQQMDQFDVGLALEPLENRNAALTQSNKIGSYFLAGLAIAATDTPGQREVMEQAPNAGFIYPAGNPQLLADGLRGWLNDRNALSAAKQAAWEAARSGFSWDFEKEKFFAALQTGSSQ